MYNQPVTVITKVRAANNNGQSVTRGRNVVVVIKSNNNQINQPGRFRVVNQTGKQINPKSQINQLELELNRTNSKNKGNKCGQRVTGNVTNAATATVTSKWGTTIKCNVIRQSTNAKINVNKQIRQS